MSQLQRTAGIAACVFLFIITLGASAQNNIIGGEETDEYPWVGLVGNVLRGGDSAGTLIETRKVLTSAHTLFREGATPSVLDIPLRPSEVWVNFAGTVYPILAIQIHPDFNPATLENDVALLILPYHVTGIPTVEVSTSVPTVGTPVEFVGFGSSGTYLNGQDGSFGTKRVGTNTISEVTSDFIKWVFDSADEANTALGDSGAPVFINGKVAAIHTAGTTEDAGQGDTSLNTRMDIFADWINDPYTGDRILVYSFAENGIRIGDESVSSQRFTRRGYVAINSFDNEVVAAVATKPFADRLWSVGTEDWGADVAVATTVQGSRRPWAILATQQSFVTSTSYTPNHFIWRYAEGRTDGRTFAALAPIAKVLRGNVFETDEAVNIYSQSNGYILRFNQELSSRTANLTTSQVADQLLNRLENQIGTNNINSERLTASTSDVTIANGDNSATSSTIRVHKISGTVDLLGLGDLSRARLAGYLVFQGSTDQLALLIVVRDREGNFYQKIEFSSSATYDQIINYLALKSGRRYLHVLGALDESAFNRLLLTGVAFNDKDARIFRGDAQSVADDQTQILSLRTRELPRLTRDFEGDSFSEVLDAMEARTLDEYNID